VLTGFQMDVELFGEERKAAMIRTQKQKKLIRKVEHALFSGMIEEESDRLLKLYLAINIRIHKVTLRQIDERQLRWVLQPGKPKSMRKLIRMVPRI